MGESQPMACYLSEFVGTFILVLTVGCNVLSGQPIWGGVSIACALTVMIYALGKASGANFNPAVSLALGLAGKLSWDTVAAYMCTQVVGGILAGVMYSRLFGSAFNLGPTAGHYMWQAAAAEILYTFMLCFVVLNVACSKKHGGKNQFYGLAIGFVVTAGAYSGGSVSMGCFNPAVAFGIDVSSAHIGFGNCIFYTIFEFIGAALAAALFFAVRPDERTEKQDDDFEYPMYSKLLSEFLGTFMLVLTVGLNVLSGSTAGAFSIAAALMSMIFALGTVSGAHFNPAVTVAIFLSGREKCTGQEAALYMPAQLLGGAMGAFMYSHMQNGQTFALKPYISTWGQVFIAEFVFTFVLSFVVLSVATTRNALSEFFGFAIGMCVTVGGVAIGKVSGGSLNPAVSFGISTIHIVNGGEFWPCLVYMVPEFLAGCAAAALFQITQPNEYGKDFQAEHSKA